MRPNRNEKSGRQGTRAAIRPVVGSAVGPLVGSAVGSALALAAVAVATLALATGLAATASAATSATGAHTDRLAVAANLEPAASGEKVTVTSHFVWTPTSGNSSGDSTFIDNGATNNKKNDLLFVMPNLTPGGISPCPCLLSAIAPVGVWYSDSQWAIFNEDTSAMNQLLAFNVLVVPKASKSAFAVHATSSDSRGDYVIIDSPLTNGHPNALIQVTQNFGSPGVYNPHPVGVRYFQVRRRWAIFNEDGAAMPHSASFNVLIGSAASNGGRTAVLTATAANRPANAVLISDPETTGNPNNVLFATEDFNPGGKGGTSNSGHVIAAYSGSQEALLNWAGQEIPLKAAFNLLIFSS